MLTNPVFIKLYFPHFLFVSQLGQLGGKLAPLKVSGLAQWPQLLIPAISLCSSNCSVAVTLRGCFHLMQLRKSVKVSCLYEAETEWGLLDMLVVSRGIHMANSICGEFTKTQKLFNPRLQVNDWKWFIEVDSSGMSVWRMRRRAIRSPEIIESGLMSFRRSSYNLVQQKTRAWVWDVCQTVRRFV